MKAKVRQFRGGETAVSNENRVLVEIESFLQALSSYPERFAQQPDISFEQHRNSLMQAVAAQQRQGN